MILANCAHYLCRVQIGPWQASSTTAAEARRSQLTQIWIIEARRRSSWWSQAQLVTQTHGHGVVTAGRTATMCVILLFIRQVISDQMTLCLVDWIIVGTFDNHFDPVDEDSAFSEREIKLPNASWWLHVVSCWNIMKKVSLERAQRQIASEKPDKAG